MSFIITLQQYAEERLHQSQYKQFQRATINYFSISSIAVNQLFISLDFCLKLLLNNHQTINKTCARANSNEAHHFTFLLRLSGTGCSDEGIGSNRMYVYFFLSPVDSTRVNLWKYQFLSSLYSFYGRPSLALFLSVIVKRHTIAKPFIDLTMTLALWTICYLEKVFISFFSYVIRTLYFRYEFVRLKFLKSCRTKSNRKMY